MEQAEGKGTGVRDVPGRGLRGSPGGGADGQVWGAGRIAREVGPGRPTLAEGTRGGLVLPSWA